MAPLLPEPPQGPGGRLGPVGLAGLDRPAEGGADVGVLGVAAVQPLALVVGREVGLGLDGQVEEPPGVAAGHGLEVAEGLELLGTELPDRLQHREPGRLPGRLDPADQ